LKNCCITYITKEVFICSSLTVTADATLAAIEMIIAATLAKMTTTSQTTPVATIATIAANPLVLAAAEALGASADR
jgi:hypothetical protein